MGQGKADLVRLLLGAGAAADRATGLAGETPLSIAAEQGQLEIARLLVEAGSSCDPVRKDGATPLYIAVRLSHFDIAMLLIQWGASISIARDFASSNGYAKTAAELRNWNGRLAPMTLAMPNLS